MNVLRHPSQKPPSNADFVVNVAADIFEDVENKVAGSGVEVWCVGGGRILHTPEDKKLNVFGYSQVGILNFNLSEFLRLE
jgi:hypothetical protein